MKFLILVALTFFSSNLIAENISPLERANQIKEWRANCSDPDPDLRLAYLEAAIATNDTTIKRTCVKQGLISSDGDMQNLALRSALAFAEQLTVEFFLPEEFVNEYEAIKGDDSKLKVFNEKWYQVRRSFDAVQGRIGLQPKSVNITNSKSQWYTLGLNTRASEKQLLTLNVVGNKVSGNGNYSSSGFSFSVSIDLQLSPEGTLVGVGRFGRDGAVHKVKIKLY